MLVNASGVRTTAHPRQIDVYRSRKASTNEADLKKSPVYMQSWNGGIS